jgi:3-hydroxyisobutyrate dehydrogenase/2-hydroxy-3-oxopropionate reductase
MVAPVTLDVAVLGTGRMGGAMAGTLRRAGFPVRVWNRTVSRAEGVAEPIGAEVADTAREAVADADVTISSLADDEAVVAAYTGPDGAVEALREGQVALEMSTVAPHTVAQLGPEVERTGAALLDAPVSGSVSVVEQGALTIMVGGDERAQAKAQPVLDALGDRVVHIGLLGTGATMKLAVNALIHAIDVGVSEALVLAERAGVERSVAYEIFASGAAAAPFVLYKREAFEHPDETPPAFLMDLMAKDLDLILELAEEVGAPMDQARQNRVTVGEALESGFSGRDLSAVAEFLRTRS